MKFSSISGRLLTAIVFGIFSALGSIPHGIGLILQGRGRPDGIVLNTWVSGPIAENLGGEPGMTLIPDFMISGIVTIILSVILIAWIIFFSGRKFGGILSVFGKTVIDNRSEAPVRTWAQLLAAR